MESWTPQEQVTETTPPRDAWGIWLSRAPLHDVTPDPQPAPARLGAAMILAGLGLFWGAAAVLVWRLFA